MPDLRLVPCGEQAAVGLDDRTGGRLAAARAELGSGEGGLFIEVRGTRTANGIVAREIVRAFPAGEGPWCDSLLAPGELRAHGNEPFWSLTMRRGGIEWADPERGSVVFPPAVLSVDDGPRPFGIRTYTSEIPSTPVRRLTVRVHADDCRDGMSGAWFRLAAEVQLDGVTMQGCAYEGS